MISIRPHVFDIDVLLWKGMRTPFHTSKDKELRRIVHMGFLFTENLLNS